MNKIKQLFQKPINKLYEPFKYNVDSVFNWFRWRIVKRRALRAWKYTGKQHFVLPSGKHKLQIVNKPLIMFVNKQPGVRKINVNHLENIAYFCTPEDKAITDRKNGAAKIRAYIKENNKNKTTK